MSETYLSESNLELVSWIIGLIIICWFVFVILSFLIIIWYHLSHKYLVNGHGKAVKSYHHKVQPMAIENDIVALLDLHEQQKMQVPMHQ